MISLPSVSFATPYNQESQNNNAKAIKLLRALFPETVSEAHLIALYQAAEAMVVIDNTTKFGTCLIHLDPSNVNVETRFNYPTFKRE